MGLFLVWKISNFLLNGHKIYLNVSIYNELINELWRKAFTLRKGRAAILRLCARATARKQANEQEYVSGSWYSRSCSDSAVSYPPLQQPWLSSPEVLLHS